MLKINLFRPILSGWGKLFFPAATQNVVGYHYGNSNMPDTLYKTIELEMKSAEPAVLKSYESFITMVAENLGVEVGDRWDAKPRLKRWTLLKSVHIYRKHLVQYEVRTYYRWIRLHKMTGSTAQTLLEYVERMLPEGVGLKVTKLSIEPIPNHLSPDEIKKVLGSAAMERENKQVSSEAK